MGLDKSSQYLKKELKYIGIPKRDEEVKNIQILAERKYNRYDQYLPGETFQYRLIQWLLNFDEKDRENAMEIIENLVYINTYELRSLAVSTFWNSIKAIHKEFSQKNLSKKILQVYLEKKRQETKQALKRSLFVAVADDVKFDYFRRRTQRRFPQLEKDNFVEYYKLHKTYQKQDLDGLREFDRIFLLDQLCGSGITFLRKKDEKWKGKIVRFFEIWQSLEGKILYYMPYMMSTAARKRIDNLLPAWKEDHNISNEIIIFPTLYIPMSNCLSASSDGPINKDLPVAKLCDKYFEGRIDCILDEHTEKGGDCRWGFGGAGLILVLNTNCPNNTIPVIWCGCGDWYPLFPRIEHHP